jgi:hypothetical protein
VAVPQKLAYLREMKLRRRESPIIYATKISPAPRSSTIGFRMD